MTKNVISLEDCLISHDLFLKAQKKEMIGSKRNAATTILDIYGKS